jgi:hypothetical protein
MEEGSRICLPRYNLPMHTTPVRHYPGAGWCSNRAQYLGIVKEHGGL